MGFKFSDKLLVKIERALEGEPFGLFAREICERGKIDSSPQVVGYCCSQMEVVITVARNRCANRWALKREVK
jgi:hypothetical protein